MVSLPPGKFSTLLSSPFHPAAIPTLILILLLPVRHERYRLELKSSTQASEGNWHSYCDLDGDGNSEEIVAFDNDNSSGITISSGSIILNQWNKLVIQIIAENSRVGLHYVFFNTQRQSIHMI